MKKISLQRKNSQRKIAQEETSTSGIDAREKAIDQLRRRIDALQTNKQSHETGKDQEPSITRHDNENQKNVIPAQRTIRGENKELTEMKSFISTVMETLKDFDKRLTVQLNRVDPFGKVINLSKLNFSLYEFEILGYNLNFIPTPNFFNEMNFNRDVKQFHRRIKLRSHFGITESPNLTEKIFNKSNSTWKPKEIHHTVNTFIEDVTQKINNSLQEQRNIKTIPKKNLTKYEEKALKDLMKRNDIIICNADKGGADIKEADRQLSDEHFYKKLPKDATLLPGELVNNAIEHLKNRNLISEKLANGLKVSDPKTPLYATYYRKFTRLIIQDVPLLAQLAAARKTFLNL